MTFARPSDEQLTRRTNRIRIMYVHTTETTRNKTKMAVDDKRKIQCYYMKIVVGYGRRVNKSTYL